MRKIKRTTFVALLIMALLSMTSYGAELPWRHVPDKDKVNVFFQAQDIASDTYVNKSRGMLFAEGYSEIGNMHNGNIHIYARTLAFRYVDCVRHSLFLDQWDEERQDWKQVGNWDFEKTKEEEPDLSYLVTGFSVTGYPMNLYYRVRGLHQVVLGDAAEGHATATHGVLITAK